MTPARRLAEIGRHLHAILGAPGLLIGVFSIVSFGFGLFVLAREYDRPMRTGRNAVHRIVGNWVRLPLDYLGRNLIDFTESWRDAPEDERPHRLEMLREALDQLGAELDRQSERFPLIHVVAMELAFNGS
jgi:hypothetical protein